MIDTHPFAGVYAPVMTPFAADLTPDMSRLTDHCRWLRDHGCGVVLFGTTGEGNSLAVEEKIDVLNALAETELDRRSILIGAGACAFPDAVRVSGHASALGYGGVLMLPPFYYKDVNDEGLFRAFSEVIERVGDPKLRVYLYHIPPVALVPISLGLIERLIDAYPTVVVGLKDSSGDGANICAVLDAFPGFGVFVGSETGLLDTLRRGGAGCISATVNIDPQPIRRLFDHWRTPEADSMHTAVSSFRGTMRQFPLIPALKAVIARYADDPAWQRLRPPLVELTDPERAALFAKLDARGFSMPGLRKT